MNIIIQGYYGFRNLGDDLLCAITLRILHEFKPDANISVLSLAPDPDYITRLTDVPITIVREIKPDKFDLLFYGGGGVFFDFQKGSAMHRIVNGMIKRMGTSGFSRLLTVYGKGKNIPLQAGIGIGVGTFTSDSKKFWYKYKELSGMDQLYVRDERSIKNLKAINFTGPVTKSTDLAFFLDAWFQDTWTQQSPSKRRKVAAILRDWKTDNSEYLGNVYQWLTHLQSEGLDVTIVSFDRQHDSNLLNQNPGFKSLTWNPDMQSLNDFMIELNSYDIFLTSRAHGAIIGGCLRKPVVIIELEEKLRQIHGMFPASTELVNVKETPRGFKLILDQYLERFSYDDMNDDVESNHRQILKSVNKLKVFIDSTL